MNTTQLPTLRQLQYLVTLGEVGNFRKAAEAFDITQPSLSTQLKALEETLGVALAERGRGGVVLTPVGREVTERARRVIADVQAIVDTTAGAQHGLGGTLRLGVPHTLSPYLLPHVIKRLHRKHPDLKLYVREAAPHVIQRSLADGEFDLILTPLPVSSSDLAVDRLFRKPLYFVCATDHPLAGQADISPKDLKGAQVLALESQHHLHDQIVQICDDFGAELLRDYKGTSLDTLRHMVGSGLGVSFLPALYVRSEIGARGEVSIGTVKSKNIFRTIGMAWRKQAADAEFYQVFAETIRAVVRVQFKEISLI